VRWRKDIFKKLAANGLGIAKGRDLKDKSFNIA
jgi:hypothetical protein